VAITAAQRKRKLNIDTSGKMWIFESGLAGNRLEDAGFTPPQKSPQTKIGHSPPVGK
jgi:hypothetical protein